MNARAPTTALQKDQPAQLPVRFDAEALISQAIDKNLPIESLQKLLEMRKELMQDAAKGAFFDALSRFQSVCPIIKKKKTAKIKTTTGGEFEYKYAPLDHIVKIVAPLLTEHGLSYRIESNIESTACAGKPGIKAKCIVYHTAGHNESSEFVVPIDALAKMNDMQKHASAMMYAKRYAFCNAFGILTGDGDDDGNAGGAKARQEAEPGNPSEPAEAQQPGEYPAKAFNANLPKWKDLMTKGEKNAEDIIAIASSRYTLSDSQKLKIRAAGGVSK